MAEVPNFDPLEEWENGVEAELLQPLEEGEINDVEIIWDGHQDDNELERMALQRIEDGERQYELAEDEPMGNNMFALVDRHSVRCMVCWDYVLPRRFRNCRRGGHVICLSCFDNQDCLICGDEILRKFLS